MADSWWSEFLPDLNSAPVTLRGAAPYLCRCGLLRRGRTLWGRFYKFSHSVLVRSQSLREDFFPTFRGAAIPPAILRRGSGGKDPSGVSSARPGEPETGGPATLPCVPGEDSHAQLCVSTLPLAGGSSGQAGLSRVWRAGPARPLRMVEQLPRVRGHGAEWGTQKHRGLLALAVFAEGAVSWVSGLSVPHPEVGALSAPRALNSGLQEASPPPACQCIRAGSAPETAQFSSPTDRRPFIPRHSNECGF